MNNFRYYKIDSLNNINNNVKGIEYDLLKWKLNFLKSGNLDNKLIESSDAKITENSAFYVRSYHFLNKGDYIFNNKFSNDSLAFSYYKKSLDLAIEYQDELLICEALKSILYYIGKNKSTHKEAPYYLNLYKEYAYDQNESLQYNFYKLGFDAVKLKKSQVENYRVLLPAIIENENRVLEAKFYQSLGNNFSFFHKELDSANYYYDKAIDILSTIDCAFANQELFGLYVNKGFLEKKRQNKKSIDWFSKADKIQLLNKKKSDKVVLYKLLSQTYTDLKKFDSAYYFLKKEKDLSDSLNQIKHATAITEFETKYQTEKKEKENIALQAKNEQNQLYLLSSLGLLFTVISIGFLSVKNSKKKRFIAEQNEELEKQKVTNLLKEQELLTIDAMVEGQEKERKHIAEDLHDNLGSVLATLKLHFENYRINKHKKKIDENALLDKTETLLDEAYYKVRSIAHAKNSGVIANQGLLTAVKAMADKVSLANNLTIEVLDYGLDRRLDNTLELNLFRIIQELITNIIKHARATKASIQITLYDDAVNIIVEDNGIGFDTKNINDSGMGLQSIRTRISYLNGNFAIDSQKEKGSTIIINIPL